MKEKHLKLISWGFIYFLQLIVYTIFNHFAHITNTTSDYVFAMFMAYLIVYED